MACGIYKFTNKINGKIYIGQSVNIDRRITEHFCRHDGTPFHLALEKYGKENFIIEILEECKPEELNEKEKYYISLYNSENKQIGYNRTCGGEGRAKKSVKQYNSKGCLIKEYISITVASLETGIPSSNIQACCGLKPSRKSAGGFQWRYSEDSAPKEYEFNQVEHLKQISQLAKRKGNKNGRPSKEKDVVIWRMQHPSGTKAECIRETGISKSTVYKYWAAAQSDETLD